MSRRTHRSASLVITFIGAIVNLALTIQLLAVWRSLKWEPESEWESSGWRVNGVKLVWGLLSTYFAAATTVCTIGFVGVIKNKPAYVRLYRDYSIADFSFCTFFTLLGTYVAIFEPYVRTGVCEELSRQPELMRDLVEMGLNVENCELWFERAVLVGMAGMVVLIVIRLHFLIAVSKFYSHLSRYHQRSLSLPTHAHSLSHSHTRTRSDPVQRIYLLPRSSPLPLGIPLRPASSPSTAAATQQPSSTPTPPGSDDIIVYAPVPLSSLPPHTASDLRASATEAWVSRSEPERAHRHRHSYSHSHHHTESRAGKISLPIRPDEPLLPGYEDMKA